MSVDISCQNWKLDSFWAGEWQSSWTIDQASQVLKGSLKIRCHYFELGNTQLNLDKDFDSVAVKDFSSAKDIVKALREAEDKVSTIIPK